MLLELGAAAADLIVQMYLGNFLKVIPPRSNRQSDPEFVASPGSATSP